MSIEDTIKSLLEESRQLKEILEEGETNKEDEDNKKNNVDSNKEAEGDTTKKDNVATKDAVSPENMNKIKEDEDLEDDTSYDMSEAVAALFNGEDGLTEEFKVKAETIFEAAVTSRIKEEISTLEEEYQNKLEEKVSEISEGLAEHVDGYLNLMVEQWMKDNEVALESGMKIEIFEGFVEGMKNLFKEHYVEVPNDRFDVVSALESEIETLHDKINETTDLNVALNTKLMEIEKREIVAESCSGLSDIEADKLKTLAEELVYESKDTFVEKIQTIRENYFNKKYSKETKGASFITEEVIENDDISSNMQKYVSALSMNAK